MRVYLFSEIDQPNRAAFRSYFNYQNLKTVKTIGLVYFLLSVGIRVFGQFTNIPFSGLDHIDELGRANFISIAVTPLFYFASMLFIEFFEYDKLVRLLGHILVIMFALFIITNGMRVTFSVMHNPRNSLVMYLAALTLAAVFFTFEYYETLLVSIATFIIFMLGLPYFQTDVREVLLNNMVSFVLLTLFFCISRYLFSYRADNYLKLRAIEEKNKEIETASKLKNEILGIVAHDLRNPLTAIIALSGMMESDETMSEDNRENLQMIKLSCDKATSIINDLLETANNENDTAFDIEEIEINQYLLKIADEWVKNKMGQTNILYFGTDHPIYTLINSEKMQRVMDNLISNAIKFSGPSDRIEIRLRDAGGQIFIDIVDFGMGIPESLLPYIFDRFSRASRRGLRGEESVGLGLSIVKQIVEKHGGQISVMSTEKQGTTFTICMASVTSSSKASA